MAKVWWFTRKGVNHLRGGTPWASHHVFWGWWVVGLWVRGFLIVVGLFNGPSRRSRPLALT